MKVQSVESLYRLLASVPGQGSDIDNSDVAEPLTYHRKGRWFNSSIAHHTVR